MICVEDGGSHSPSLSRASTHVYPEAIWSQKTVSSFRRKLSKPGTSSVGFHVDVDRVGFSPGGRDARFYGFSAKRVALGPYVFFEAG